MYPEHARIFQKALGSFSTCHRSAQRRRGMYTGYVGAAAAAAKVENTQQKRAKLGGSRRRLTGEHPLGSRRSQQAPGAQRQGQNRKHKSQRPTCKGKSQQETTRADVVRHFIILALSVTYGKQLDVPLQVKNWILSGAQIQFMKQFVFLFSGAYWVFVPVFQDRFVVRPVPNLRNRLSRVFIATSLYCAAPVGRSKIDPLRYSCMNYLYRGSPSLLVVLDSLSPLLSSLVYLVSSGRPSEIR